MEFQEPVIKNPKASGCKAQEVFCHVMFGEENAGRAVARNSFIRILMKMGMFLAYQKIIGAFFWRSAKDIWGYEGMRGRCA